ncbi:MAG: helix-turn-helix domain-containing protein [Moraxellaceae bacterium]|nr:helix-turn-helix domain-containing protein [Moraxellaceae bacterium]
MDDLPFIPVIYFHKLVELMREDHIDTEQILRECGISPHVLSRPDTMLTPRQARLVITKFMGLSPSAYPGVRFGKGLDLLTHGLLGYVFFWEGDFRELLTNIGAYLQVRFPLVRIEVQTTTEYFSLRISCDERIRDIEPFMIQTFLGSLYALGSMVTKNITISCRRDLFRELKPLQTMLTPNITHNDVFNEICYYSSEPRQDAAAAAPMPAETTDTRLEEHGFILRMRGLLLENLRDNMSADDVASELGMSVRTLRRRLSDLGMSFNKIRTDVRMQVAMRYLTTTRISIERIADLVGYSDQATFTRAFREWAGKTPNEVRQHRIGKLAATEPDNTGH